MDPVDARVGEEEEDGVLRPIVPPPRTLGGCIVQLRVAAHFGKEPWHCEDCHDGEGDVGLLHLELYLVLEVSRVLEGCLIEDEEVGCACKDIVYDDAEKPAVGASVCVDST